LLCFFSDNTKNKSGKGRKKFLESVYKMAKRNNCKAYISPLNSYFTFTDESAMGMPPALVQQPMIVMGGPPGQGIELQNMGMPMGFGQPPQPVYGGLQNYHQGPQQFPQQGYPSGPQIDYYAPPVEYAQQQPAYPPQYNQEGPPQYNQGGPMMPQGYDQQPQGYPPQAKYEF
jgi:hypothetical protein